MNTGNPNLTSPRREVVVIFRELIRELDSSSIQRVLVVGGPPTEPELHELQQFANIEVHYAGIEEIESPNWYFLDANYPEVDITDKFDFILCSQVLEHLWNPLSVFKLINGLLKPSGYAWIACPANNFPHGSPDFYSAGYSVGFLELAAKHAKLTNIKSGTVANQRIHFYRQLLQLWPTYFQFNYPFFAYFPIEGSFRRKIYWQFKTLPQRFAICFSSKNFSRDLEFGLEVWILVKKSPNFS